MEDCVPGNKQGEEAFQDKASVPEERKDETQRSFVDFAEADNGATQRPGKKHRTIVASASGQQQHDLS